MNPTTRRQFLTGLAGAAVVGVAGCTVEYNGPGAGRLPSGGVPALQDIQPGDADVQADTVEQLKHHASQNDGRVVWLPSENLYDFSGTTLTVTDVTIASGRSSSTGGATILTEDEGTSSPAWAGGSNGTGLIRMEDNARITGVEIRGPHTSVTEHQAIPGYFPFAPGSEAERERWREARFARGIHIQGDNCRVDNSEVWAFSVQGIAVGGEGAVSNAIVAYSHVHNTMMTSYGYCVDIRHGDVTVYKSYLDAARHAMCGSGHADANYYVLESTIGPWTSSHPLDMHRVGENESGSSDPSDSNWEQRAGGTMLVRGSDILAKRVPDLPFINHNQGGGTPHARIRGVPLDGFYFEDNRCSHPGIGAGIEQSGVPSRYTRDEHGFVNIYSSGNQWANPFEAVQQIP
ncbi:hypothetical protein [Halalkalicoccus jeotgali]|uniref:Uncharacterized protein n=1 Tax=Halalkalicoccus jeotgali (strain DSM 18796 / CECT 7217 / JCM 14584 / KCTC 4019 / B3) TaxID=795797 RepID=D8J9Y3_HALJB|nr:hypothetical protein [Halalkalicoccus jeotgali]ADJ14505.1 hypothetical protein HacjB3_05570 [Halalkalicoccus jeotgali B3]ELY40217.1 hypothetical protein C497_03935 [Halalkalicoccus jeotgali B3]